MCYLYSIVHHYCLRIGGGVVHDAVVGYVVHHYCLRIGGGVVHDAVVGYVVHHYCLRFGGGVVHDAVGYILYCQPLLFEVWWWSGS